MNRVSLSKLNNIYLLSAISFGVLAGIFFKGLLSGYGRELIILLIVYILLAISWNILGGYAGEFSFGQMGFFGIGSYTVVIIDVLSKKGYSGIQLLASFPINILMAGGIASLLALLVAYPILRIRGWYFAIGTWAFAEILRTLVVGFSDYTKGAAGAYIDIPVYFTTTIDYLTALVLGFGIVIMFYKVVNSRLGLAFRSTRDNYDAAKMMGINTTLYRTIAFVLSALIAGLAGGYFVVHKNYIDPYSAFDVAWTFKMIVMVVIGGSSTIFGPILGAIIVLALEEIGRTFLLRGYLLLLAFILVIAFIFMPGGIIGAVTKQSPLQNPLKKYRRMKQHGSP